MKTKSLTEDIHAARVSTINLITAAAFYLQIEQVPEEEVAKLYSGELEPPEPELGLELDRLDKIICDAQCLLSDNDLDRNLA